MTDLSAASCASMIAKGAMYPFSSDLMAGCEHFGILAQSSTDSDATRRWNTSCLMFAGSVIDARVNEWVAIAKEIEDGPQPIAFWTEVAELQKTLSLERKWNLIASVHGGRLWNSGEEPFQSYGLIVSLRNELVHFKGEFLGKDDAPSSKIRGLMGQFKIESEATFIEGDVSSWVRDLLEQKGLASWVASKVRSFYDEAIQLLLNS